ncbi:fimbria/pilus periplasmic chaperone (plasmid) [Paraburkholderia sprentiae WSM5005]|uniref:Fimbria/pilus periplasmic chaperone n=1 Tax=Paraburkholderia sprentiae WSM5005 TaxID=754502 RepID=A0A1I9YSY4_9BURK|nr:fimbria/pilus periplasmic chaperone [Paraburkholderia sprentiae]APA90009.1 fimbria/pilus periplasmic chaperone [Paraburkholderia sprentiae WSM5005]
MSSMKFPILLAAAVACSAASFAAQAAITITGTRVIYPAQNREVNVRLNNVDSRPVLVQAWLDDGDAAAAPNEIKVPFTLLPSVFRVEPHRGQALRIMFAGGDMPNDRESVYWLNVLEIPPKPRDADDRNMIQLAFRTRIKMFYRPASLLDDPTAARAKLEWRVESDDKGESVVRLDNPSPYYISIGSAEVETAGGKVTLLPNMAAPFGQVDLRPQDGKLDIKLPATVSYTVLNDFGTAIKDSAEVEGAQKAKAQKNQ